MTQERNGNRRGPLWQGGGGGLLPRTLSTCWDPSKGQLNCRWKSREREGGEAEARGERQDSPATKSPKPMVEMVMKE